MLNPQQNMCIYFLYDTTTVYKKLDLAKYLTEIFSNYTPHTCRQSDNQLISCNTHF